MLTVNQKVKLVGFAMGIFVCYTCFGVLQEKIFRGRYGDEINEDGKAGERFTLPVAFAAVQCITYMLFAKGQLPDFIESCHLNYNLFFFKASYTLAITQKWK